MGFLRDLFGSKPKPAPWPDGPEAREFQVRDGGNVITKLLDKWGLPINEPRFAVEARYGVGPDPIYGWPTLLLPDAKELPGSMRGWTAYVRDTIPPQFPISQFSGLVWFGDDAEVNLRRTAVYIAESLGAAPIGQRWNTMVAEWQCDMAGITLTAWPPHLQSHGLNNPAHERNPRLRFACHVHVETGFCLALTADERRWVETSTMLRALPTRGNPPQSSAPHENDLEYVRRLEAGTQMETGLRLSGDGKALVLVSSHLFVIPRRRVRRLEVMRLTPAKGPGGSSLHAICDSAAPNPRGQSLFLAEDPKTDGLNGFATELSRQLDCPLDIGQAYADC